jgi:glycosyltransferase involved in cell wall biosynthesis
MREQYDWADVLVLPSISDTFALVVLEAMAAGVPVITTRNTGASDIVRDSVDGFLVPVHDPEAIANKLQMLSDDRHLLQWMSKEACSRARDFSVEAYTRRLVGLITQEIHDGQEGNQAWKAPTYV